MTRLVLASGSPRRRAFLTELGYPFEVQAADIHEEPTPGETGTECALRLARGKAAAVATRFQECVVLAADTVVLQGASILGKPADAGDFERMMKLLSGRTHQVVTAVVVHGPERVQERAVSTDVTFRELSAGEIAWYWSTNEPRDKAGGYALQGLGGTFIGRIDGSYSSVVGLPMMETVAMLEAAHVPPPWKHS